MPTPLPAASPAELGLDARQLDRLDTLIGRHIAEGRHAGAQIALARHGRMARVRSFGAARTGVEVTDDTLFLLYSQTKMLTSATVWTLIEDGTLSFMDVVEDLLPGFAAHGKAAITLQQVMTHLGGFPSAGVTPASWADHGRMRAEVCAFTLDWEPGTKLQYHGQSAHQVQAMIIEEVTGLDYRQVIRERVLAPLGLEQDIFVGVPDDQQARCADTGGRGPEENGAAFRAAGLPHAGAYATAKGMVQFYQMLAHGGRLGDVRLFSQRLLAYVARNHTGERPDLAMTGIPMHRGLGPHVRGDSDRIRGLGTLAAPETFGHGGVGSSYSWADPTTGVSFTFLTNFVQPDPWHSARLDRISNIVHAAID